MIANVQAMASERQDSGFRRRVVASLALLVAVAPLWLPHRMPESSDRDLRIVGSRSLRAPVEEWMSMYHDAYPRDRARSAMYGTGLAAGEIADRRADIAPIAREMRSGERALIGTTAPVAIHVGERRGSDSQPIFLYIARDREGRPSRSAVAFARIATSREGQARLANGGFDALPREAREEVVAELDRLGR